MRHECTDEIKAGRKYIKIKRLFLEGKKLRAHQPLGLRKRTLVCVRQREIGTYVSYLYSYPY